MTGLKAVEYIRQHHNELPLNQILDLLNEGQNDFCRKTEIHKTTIVDASVAGRRFYTLPDNVLTILKVQVDDVTIPRLQGDPIIEDDELGAYNPLPTPSSSSNDRSWYESVGRIGIVEKIGATTTAITRDGKSTDYQTIGETGLIIRLYVVSTPGTLLNVGNHESTDILSGLPGKYERAILDYVISQGYFLPHKLNPELAQVFEIKYEKAVREAKKVVKSRFIDVGRIIPNDF
jgi:hypothetical protein